MQLPPVLKNESTVDATGRFKDKLTGGSNTFPRMVQVVEEFFHGNPHLRGQFLKSITIFG
jgi:hypothetical protein